jgi:hypothetical protein
MIAAACGMSIAREHEDVAGVVEGRTIAFVANSTDILAGDRGAEIDAHDLVLRMNAGLPREEQHRAIGRRTSILTIGNLTVYQAALRAFGAGAERPGMSWWMKNTLYGERQWGRYQAHRWWKAPTWRFPKEWEDEVCALVGAPTSSGLLAVWALVTRFAPARVDVYGMTFFGALGSPDSWWHNSRAKPPCPHPHVGEKELATFRTLDFTMNPDKSFSWTSDT